MARPRKNTADWFRHDTDASNDPKIMYLESKFGLAGYAFYFKLIEFLSRSVNYEIDEPNDWTMAVYARKLGIPTDKLEEMFKASTDKKIPKDFRAFSLKNGKLFSEGLKKRMKPLEEKRDKDRERIVKNPSKNKEDNCKKVSEAKTPVFEAKTSINEAKSTQSRVEKSNISKDIFSSNEEKKKYGNKEINSMLDFLKTAIFGENSNRHEFISNKWEKPRFFAKHILNLYEKLGKDEFLFRLNGILSDDFTRKNCGSTKFLYNKIKSYVPQRQNAPPNNRNNAQTLVYD